MWLAISLIVILAAALVVAPILARRDKRIRVTSYYSLRSLPPGDELILGGVPFTRTYTVRDAEIAYGVYLKVKDQPDVRTSFVSISDFVTYVARFDNTLVASLIARVVDPSEYEIDRSGWKDDDEDDDKDNASTNSNP